MTHSGGGSSILSGAHEQTPRVCGGGGSGCAGVHAARGSGGLLLFRCCRRGHLLQHERHLDGLIVLAISREGLVVGGRGRHESLAHQAQPAHRHDQGEPGYAEGLNNKKKHNY